MKIRLLSVFFLAVILCLVNGQAHADWEQVGAAGFTPGQAGLSSLAFDSTDVPYLAYMDGAASDKVSVMKYAGTSWVQVGAAGFTPARGSYPSLAFDSADVPYVAYSDGADLYKVSVMKYVGTSWVQVGAAGFTPATGSYPSLAFDSADVPYVAYTDKADLYKVSVMKYVGTSWVQVGAAGFTPTSGVYPSLAIDSGDVPYVAYRDEAAPYKAGVMKFVSPCGTGRNLLANTWLMTARPACPFRIRSPASCPTISARRRITTCAGFPLNLILRLRIMSSKQQPIPSLWGRATGISPMTAGSWFLTVRPLRLRTAQLFTDSLETVLLFLSKYQQEATGGIWSVILFLMQSAGIRFGSLPITEYGIYSLLPKPETLLTI